MIIYFIVVTMDLEKDIPNFNEEGCLPKGIYLMNLEKFEDNFSKNKSKKRKIIMEHYKSYLNKLLKYDCVINHWIDGSFVTSKEEPNDIDTLTEFDGLKLDEDNKIEIQGIIDNAPLMTDNCCHSIGIYKYPENYEVEYESYSSTKSKVLFILFCSNKNTKNPKGFVKLDIGDD